MYYEAVYTDSDCLIGCGHKHQNVATATACISQAGGYVVAVHRRKYTPLNEAEESEFQKAMFGHGHGRRVKVPVWLKTHAKNI
jgi:Holliday junction resolvasome RuvABC endonuclease subunit